MRFRLKIVLLKSNNYYNYITYRRRYYLYLKAFRVYYTFNRILIYYNKFIINKSLKNAIKKLF